MSKCNQCKTQPVQDTLWDHIRLFIFHLFRNDIEEITSDMFTKGFGEGYKKGRDHQYSDDQRAALNLWNVQI